MRPQAAATPTQLRYSANQHRLLENGFWIVMSDSAAESACILYLGRNSEISDSLHKALEQHVASSMSDNDTSDRHAQDEGHRLVFKVVRNQKAALAETKSDPPNIVLIEMDGKPNHRYRFCEMLRYRLPKAALIAISLDKLNTSFKFDGELKAPIKVDEAIRYIYDRTLRFNGNQLEKGHIRLNIAKRIVIVEDKQYHMTPKQCALLHLLIQNHNNIITRAQIMQDIWETSYLEDTRTLDVHIRWLRERIELNPSKPKYLVTIRGVGYRLSLE